MLEPAQGDVGVVLGDLHLCAAGCVIGGECRGKVGLALRHHCFGKGDGALHRQLGAGTHRIVGGGLGVPKQDQLAEVPVAAGNARKVAPQGAVDQQRMAFQLLREQCLNAFGACRLAAGVQAQAAPAGFPHLDHPGAAAGFVLIGVGDDDAVLRLPEEVVKGVQGAG